MRIKMIDGMEIEERVELMHELCHISPSQQYPAEINRLLNEPQTISNTSSATIKGILFEIYSIDGNEEARININRRSLAYRNKIVKAISEEGYNIRQQLLDNRDRAMQITESHCN